MASETQITKTLNGLVENLVENSPFFYFWNKNSVNPAQAQKFLETFDGLVKSFPGLIAAGAARMEDEPTRVTLAVNLFQESGEGDLSRTHHAIYRKFLATAGIKVDSLIESPFAAQWRGDLLEYLQSSESPQAVLGALASGEFLAQPALGRIYPLLKDFFPHADQEYFTKHLVLEGEHVEEITGVIARLARSEADWDQVQEGFRQGLSIWEAYFADLSQFIAEK